MDQTQLINMAHVRKVELITKSGEGLPGRPPEGWSITIHMDDGSEVDLGAFYADPGDATLDLLNISSRFGAIMPDPDTETYLGAP